MVQQQDPVLFINVAQVQIPGQGTDPDTEGLTVRVDPKPVVVTPKREQSKDNDDNNKVVLM